MLSSHPRFTLISVFLPSRPSVRPSVRISVRPSVRISVRQPGYPSVRPDICPSVRISVRLFGYPSVRISVRPSIRPYPRFTLTLILSRFIQGDVSSIMCNVCMMSFLHALKSSRFRAFHHFSMNQSESLLLPSHNYPGKVNFVASLTRCLGY